MKKKTMVIWGILLAILIVAVPVIIDWLIIGSDIPSNISNSEWVNFLGSYIGAVLGAMVSLAGIIITIRYTNEQNRIDRELQVRPYCSIRYVHESKIVGTDKELASILLGCEPQENNGSEYRSMIYIKNIGLGPATSFVFESEEIDDGRDHYPILTPPNRNAVNLLQAGEEAVIPVRIWFNIDAISNEDIIDLGEPETFRYQAKPAVMTKYKNFEIKIRLIYTDIFQNRYSQNMVLKSNMYVSIEQDRKATHKCDIYLYESTPPVKLER